MSSMLSFIIFVAFFCAVQAEIQAPVVNTLNGPIKGKHYESVFGKDILAFHRIPYIKPPTGALRFKDPQPVDNWTEVLDCSLPPIPSFNKNILLSKYQPVIEGDESAIHINAYSTNLIPDKLRPVMVWIHGGAFISDSSSTRLYSPDYLLEKDVVLFTFNYRLSVFGFLSLDEPKLQVPGNAGLKDQTMALRWIKKNCGRFGGDSDSITLFGESAGSASVHYHSLSDMSSGLFHRAILMSGTALSPWASIDKTNNGLQLAKLLGWRDDEPVEKALEILQNANGTELLNAVDTLILSKDTFNMFHPFLPIIEPYVSEQCFISKPVADMMVDPWSKNIPLIISSTSNEGLLLGMLDKLSNNEIYEKLGDFSAFVPKDLASNNTEQNTELGLRIKQLYYGDDQPSGENYQRFFNIISDTWFIRYIYKVLQSRGSNPSVPTYLLRFDFASKRFNHFKVVILEMGDEPGACHADDLSYIFKNDLYEKSGGLPTDSKEFKTMQRMVNLFTNFALTSNPNGGEIDGVIWEPLISNALPYKCLNVDDDLEFIEWPENSRMHGWDLLEA